ncbi:RINT-1 family protein [Rasamsonia emersonii CBS 393.64]|uniref:RINT-1 family protein n=1 Tax=Rasamsonia emersonii (strain ATCC 16479 / CBS 393.64 / IMI 116815) TaxID=1408163 RepID=A0A0F4YPS5_RASE3|nr:RINT-1 family protein [Rasamsonia emersonii CBS 393.64]KKA20272.1 RINT-1 family protein [Rasamsonia emersonii CBS 393.64]
MASTLSRLPSQEIARVEDYLNDKIQSSADLESLDSLLSNLRAQHELQQRQLVEAQEALAKATKASNDHAEAVRKQVEAFNQQQADIDRRLKILTQSETSDEAVRIFESSMEKLRRLDIAKGYLDLLQEVEAPRTALSPYTRLKNIASSLKDAQFAAEGAAPHLVDHTEKLASALREQLRKDFSSRLQRALEKMKWPGKDLVLTDSLIEEWAESVELLLDLQEPELEPRTPASSIQAKDPPVLFPLEVMVHPLELRFKYHFSGAKPTNRLDKPEYFLSHISDLISTYAGFITTYMQPIFDKRADTAGSDLEWNFLSALNAFIIALLPMLRQKISTFVPQVVNNPPLLSHFIHELMNFDTDIRDTWNYLPDPYSSENWKGLTWEVLTKQGWFDRWLQVEKDFALSRYKDIIDTADSGQIDYDGVEPNVTKPTKAAIRVNDLLETITDRYRPLSSFSQKLRFLIDIQITIFDQFHERLHSGLEAYLAMTSTIGRTVQGSDAQTSLEGVAGLERLCRIFGSAEYLEKKMQDWSDDVFFLELWSELQNRVRKNTSGGKNVVGPMSVSEVAQRTSQAVADNFNNGGTAMADGALFDETASAYRRLRLRSENIIISTLTSEVQSSLRSYSRVSMWSTLSAPATAASSYPHPPSSDLTPAIRTLSSSISFLARALGSAPLRRITRQVLLSTQTYIWDNVLMRHTFSAAGASQLASDVDHLCSVVDSALGQQTAAVGYQGESKRVIKRLVEGLTLLCLRIKPQGRTDAGEVETPETDSATQERQALAEKELGLWEVEKRLFANNESAREVLSELEIETLTESEARAVLEKRVEIRS